MPGPYGPATFDYPHPLDIEIGITEVVDNSIDAKATRIHIGIAQDRICETQFEIRVYDNGTRVSEENWTQENIDKAFVIEVDPNAPEMDRDDDAIGKFHVGMKIATLSKYNFVSMFTMVGENLLQKHGMYPDEDKLSDDPRLIYGGLNNPFNNTPQHIDVEEIETYFENNTMHTCVLMSHPRMKVLTTSDTDYSCIVAFRKHLKNYLGIVYQKYLEDEDFELTILDMPRDESQVIPLDPFWSKYTPSELNRFNETLEDPDEQKEVENLARFGTLKTRNIPVEIDGSTLNVEGFIIPHETSRNAFGRYWPEDRYEDQHTKSLKKFKVANSGSENLAGTNMGGFYFYRGKRCINFGGDLSNNQGFYELITPQQNVWVGRLRVKIEYNRGLDHLLKLHPNKKGYLSIDDEIWNAIKDSLSSHVGGGDYVRPFNQRRSFVGWDDKNNQFHYTNGQNLTRGARPPPNFKYSKCENCGLEVHDSEDLCPLVNCPECGNAGEGCSLIQCNHTCSFCGLDECEGEEHCHLNCQHCDLTIHHENDEECENYCDICRSFECTCIDEDDGDGEGDGEGEGEGEGDGEQTWAPSSMRYFEGQEEIQLMLNKNDRERNIQLLSESLEILEIDSNELV
jgi:hypothetical protein